MKTTTDGGGVAVLTRISGRDRLDVRRGYGKLVYSRAVPSGRPGVWLEVCEAQVARAPFGRPGWCVTRFDLFGPMPKRTITPTLGEALELARRFVRAPHHRAPWTLGAVDARQAHRTEGAA